MDDKEKEKKIEELLRKVDEENEKKQKDVLKLLGFTRYPTVEEALEASKRKREERDKRMEQRKLLQEKDSQDEE